MTFEEKIEKYSAPSSTTKIREASLNWRRNQRNTKMTKEIQHDNRRNRKSNRESN